MEQVMEKKTIRFVREWFKKRIGKKLYIAASPAVVIKGNLGERYIPAKERQVRYVEDVKSWGIQFWNEAHDKHWELRLGVGDQVWMDGKKMEVRHKDQILISYDISEIDKEV